MNLSELPQLPKLHYAGPLEDSLMVKPDIVEQLARICGGLMVQLDWVSVKALEICTEICAANDCRLALTYRPYSKGMAPQANPLDFGQLSAERNRLATRLGMLVGQPVSAIYLECERWRVGQWPDWAFNYVYNSIYDLCKTHFPAANVSWWGSGLRKVSLEQDFAPHGHFPGSEIRYHDARHVSLYFPDRIELCEETILTTLNRLAIAVRPHILGVDCGGLVVPWVSLGCGYRWLSPRWRCWEWDLEYDAEHDAKLGQALNQSEWPIEAIAFYPPPYSPRVPSWEQHFAAYVKGATDVSD